MAEKSRNVKSGVLSGRHLFGPQVFAGSRDMPRDASEDLVKFREYFAESLITQTDRETAELALCAHPAMLSKA